MDRSLLVNKDGLTEKEFLKQYRPGDYERPSVTVDMLIFTVTEKEVEDRKKLPEKELKILLIKRKDHPYIGQWAIPGGFVGIHESIDDAAYRELKEETNIDNVYMNQIYTFGAPERDPRMRVISTAYMALVPQKGLKPLAGDDASEVSWFSVKRRIVEDGAMGCRWKLELTSDDGKVHMEYDIVDKYVKRGRSVDIVPTVEGGSLTNDSLAFDHIDVVVTALTRLKNQIQYTSIVFNLVDEYFTLRELQQIYEIILAKKLQTTQFRRFISKMIEPTDMVFTDKICRPAKYYKFNPNYMLNDKML